MGAIKKAVTTSSVRVKECAPGEHWSVPALNDDEFTASCVKTTISKRPINVEVYPYTLIGAGVGARVNILVMLSPQVVVLPLQMVGLGTQVKIN